MIRFSLCSCEFLMNPRRVALVTGSGNRRVGWYVADGLAMVRQPEGGCIVTVGDWAVARPYVGYAAYFPSKGAIPTLTRCLAVELGSRNPAVRVNCVLPGPVFLPTDLPEAERLQAVNA